MNCFRQLEGKCSKHQLCLYLCGPIFVIAWILFGVLYELMVDNLLDQRAYVCDKSNYFYDPWRDSSKAGGDLKRSFYFYNISNPYEAMNGGSYVLTEVGPWTYPYSTKKYNIDFNHDNGTVRYRLYTRFDFSRKKSCDICDENIPLNAFNMPWQVVLMNAHSEGMIGLSSLCTTAQITQIAVSTTAVCTDEQRGNPSAPPCACCHVPNCQTLIDPRTSTTTGMLSYLAKLDGGALVSHDTPALPLLDAIYSPAIQSTSPREIIGGKASALMGLVQARQAIAANDETTLSALAQFTHDYYYACQAHCPNPQDVGAHVATFNNNQTETAQYIGSLSCDGIISDDDAVVDDVKHDYLVGMNCRSAFFPFFGFLLAIKGGEYECADGGFAPCCMSNATFSLVNDGKPIQGFGCLREIPGYTLTRYTSSEDEWDEVNQEEYEEYTGCKHGERSLAQEFIEFKSATEALTWFTPTTYTFPDMPYADSVYPRSVAQGDYSSGTPTINPISGKDVPNRKPDGFTSGFFDYQGTDGKLTDYTVSVFSRTLQAPNEFYFDKVVRTHGVDVSKMTMNYTSLTAQTVENQKAGYGVPYRGFYAGLQYVRGAPVFMSFPHYHQCDPAVFGQNDNTIFGIPSSTSGVELYTVVSEYKDGASTLSTPVVIDEDYSSNHLSLYDIKTLVDPFTGKALGSNVALLVSITIWKCDAELDPTCQFMRSAGTDYCYPQGPTSAPCSASNLFTPAMLPAKILSNFFIIESGGLNNDGAQIFHNAFTTRFASHILLVVGTVIGLAMIAFSYKIGLDRKRRQLPGQSQKALSIDDSAL